MISQINEAKRESAAQWNDRMKRRKDTRKHDFDNGSQSQESKSSYDECKTLISAGKYRCDFCT